MSERHILLVLSNPVADKTDAEFNDWYDNVHLSEVLAVPGFVAAQRYAISPEQMADPAGASHRYVAIYEVEGGATEALEALGKATANGMDMGTTLNFETVSAWLYTPNGPRQVEL